ncbi:helix-turn-helix domain-containing protein [Saccharopolyspora sp. NPDC002376]
MGLAHQELADLLARLKKRSGLSYSEIARRCFTSRSTVHRYCTGTTAPSDYQSVARVAHECGATSSELNALLPSWRAVKATDTVRCGR